MRVITFNANGIRAAARKGFFEWLSKQSADVVCLQETKAQMTELKDVIFRPAGYHCYFHDAEKKGYSGVGIFTKREPDNVVVGLGYKDIDSEGRYIQVDFGKLSIASIYLPSGSSGEHRQAAKFVFLKEYWQVLKKQNQLHRNFIICGDLNIVHKEIDIKNFKANQKNSGCLPEEREWLDKVFTELNFVDAFRVVDQRPEQYTWWSNRGNARANNVGWRIDYQIISPALRDTVKHAEIYKSTWFSDHAPLIIDYDL